MATDPLVTSVIPRLRIRIPKRLRNLELGLLVIAFIITTSSFVLVQLGALGRIDLTLAFLVVGLGVLIVGTHVALRFTAPNADPFLLPIATVINGLGIAEIYRIDIADGLIGWDAASVRQIVWTGIAVVCALVVIVSVQNHRAYQRYTYLFGLLAIVLVLLPMLPGIGRDVNGARVWIGIGPLSFQPGELAKIALAIFFAGYLVQRREALSSVGRKVLGMRLPRGRDLGPIILVWAMAMAVIVFQHDLGTGLLYFGLFLVMLYLATGRFSWIVIGIVLFGGGAFAASRVLDYVQGRFQNWLNPFDQSTYDAVGGSYQIVQGLFGLAHGGLLGTGLGQGDPTITPLPASDFIITSLGEELGLIGLFAILCLYMVFVARGLRIGFASEDDFGKLLAAGLSFAVAWQVFIVVGGVTRVVPETGLTAPFLAAGGSSLVANWIIVAMLLRLSDTVRNQPRAVAP